MIDQYGLICDKNGDSGDSCNFTCTAIALGWEPPINAISLFWNKGFPVRHPFDTPWNNPRNFTRDQAIPLMWVLAPHRIKEFLSRNKWFFPNFERDYIGSAKKPWPHRHWKDSFPNNNNYPPWGQIPALVDPDPKWELEFKWFDYADIMTPDFEAMSLILAKDPPGKICMSIAKYLCERSILDHCLRAKQDKDFVDFKQLYFTAKALGLHKYFAKMHPWGLHWAAWKYFTDVRGLPMLDKLFEQEFAREGITE